jgi:hypothetical protein
MFQEMHIILSNINHRLIEQAKNGTVQKMPLTPRDDMPRHTVQLEHLCTRQVFEEIFEDFARLVYPVAPLVHLPTMRAQLARNEHAHSQPLIRQCIGVVAVTVASLPRKLAIYARYSEHSSACSFVLRAIQLVQTSRIMDDVFYVSNPNTEHLTTSMLLSLAAHYATDTNQGWFYANEVSLFCRVMHLGERVGYDGLSMIEMELRKRAFWCCYIVQMQVGVKDVGTPTRLISE